MGLFIAVVLLPVLVVVGIGSAWFIRWFLSPYYEWKLDVPSQTPAPSLSKSAIRPHPGVKGSTDAVCDLLAAGEFPLKFPPKFDLTLVLPAYNETDRLPPCLRQTLRYLLDRQAATQTAGKSFTFEVIVVDDGSNDETAKVAQAIGEQEAPGTLWVMRVRVNRGKGHAVQLGMLASRGRYILMLDADGATRIQDLERLEQALGVNVSNGGSTKTNNEAGQPLAEIAFGSRKNLVKDAVAKRSMFRNGLMVGFHVAVSILVDSEIQDTQCGFKLFSRRAALLIFPNLHLRRWAFDIEVVYLARRFAIAIREVPVNWQEIPGSKLRVLEASLQMARDMVLLRGLYFFNLWTPRWVKASPGSQRGSLCTRPLIAL
eukprot:GHVT01061889.1.p1 GENE.GHVT01061889.1~~GHVT01061889.1.p1  ORF type:complete len:372 (-),score=31.45 GHVT01061889.1:631-1746(-)